MNNKKLTSSVVASLLLATNLFSNDLSSISVTSPTKSKQSIKDVTSNVDIITKEEIEERHFANIQEAINTLPGVSFKSNGSLGSSASLSIRGNSSRSILVLIDGVKYNDYTGISGADFGNIMISDVERIELVKGAQSGIWGADASAGVIHIITKKAKEGLHGSVNTEYGSFNTRKRGGTISYKTDDYYVKVNAQKVTSNGFTSYAAKGVDIDLYEDDAYENTTLGFDIGYNIDEANKIELKHKHIEAYKETDKSSSDNTSNFTNTDYKLTSLNFNHINKYTEINLYANTSRTDNDIQTAGTEYNGGYSEYGFNSHIEYNNEDFILWGMEYGEYERSNDVNKEYTGKSFFITNSNKIEESFDGQTIITESLRYDKYSSFDNKITGKIGVKNFHNSITNLISSFNFGTAYNVPTVSHLWAPALYGGAIPYGNENLTPEEVKSYDFSLEYNNLSATVFYNEIKDRIYYRYEGGTYYGYSNKAGKSKFKGLELAYSKDIGSDILVSLNYTWLSAKDQNDEAYKQIPKQTFKFALDYYGIKDLHVGLNGEYIGSRYNDDNNQGEQTGRYTIWNSVINYDINKELEVYLKVDNIFDKYYQTVDNYAAAPRSAYIGLKYNF